MLVSRCLQLQYEFLPEFHLSPVSRHSSLLTDRKVDTEVKSGAVHRSHGIYLTAEEIQSYETVSWRNLQSVIISNRTLYPPNDVGRIA